MREAGQGEDGFRSSRHGREVRVADWRDAEELAAWHMVHELALDEVMLTAAGVDGGVDVEGRGTVAQVKHLAVPVGAPDVQRVRGAALGRVALFYTLGGYTQQAREYADAAHIALYSFSIYGDVEAENSHAQRLVDQRPARARELADRVQAARDVSDRAARLAGLHNPRPLAPALPAQVGDLRRALSNESVTINWHAVPTADSYKIVYQYGRGMLHGSWISVTSCDIPLSGTSGSQETLTVRVKARNSAGWGELSEQVVLYLQGPFRVRARLAPRRRFLIGRAAMATA